jgi:hypothetical protein
MMLFQTIFTISIQALIALSTIFHAITNKASDLTLDDHYKNTKVSVELSG